jgi:hypothetical protein
VAGGGTAYVLASKAASSWKRPTRGDERPAPPSAKALLGAHLPDRVVNSGLEGAV